MNTQKNNVSSFLPHGGYESLGPAGAIALRVHLFFMALVRKLEIFQNAKCESSVDQTILLLQYII